MAALNSLLHFKIGHSWLMVDWIKVIRRHGFRRGKREIL
jgi:hypothetical protein